MFKSTAIPSFEQTRSLQEAVLWQGCVTTSPDVEEGVEQPEPLYYPEFTFNPEFLGLVNIQSCAPALQDQANSHYDPTSESGYLTEEGQILMPLLYDAFPLTEQSVQEGMTASMPENIGMSSVEDPILECNTTEEYRETTVCPMDLLGTVTPILPLQPYIWEKLRKNPRYHKVPRTAWIVTSHKNIPRIWFVEFEDSNGTRHPFHVCDDPALPDCHIAQARSPDMKRHLDGAKHSEANGVVVAPCSRCGEIFLTARTCTRVRHAKTCPGRRTKKRNSSEDTDDSEEYVPRASSSGPIRGVRRKRRRAPV